MILLNFNYKNIQIIRFYVSDLRKSINSKLEFLTKSNYTTDSQLSKQIEIIATFTA